MRSVRFVEHPSAPGALFCPFDGTRLERWREASRHARAHGMLALRPGRLPARLRAMRPGSATRVADDYWARIVRARGACAECGARRDIQAAHGVSRRYRSTRWDLDNGWPLCRACHKRYTHDPVGWDLWIASRIGREALHALKVRARAVARKTAAWDAIERLRPLAGK